MNLIFFSFLLALNFWLIMLLMLIVSCYNNPLRLTLIFIWGFVQLWLHGFKYHYMLLLSITFYLSTFTVSCVDRDCKMNVSMQKAVLLPSLWYTWFEIYTAEISKRPFHAVLFLYHVYCSINSCFLWDLVKVPTETCCGFYNKLPILIGI